jgi:malate dehydrogenase (oxaloacetate-decarboxylating)
MGVAEQIKDGLVVLEGLEEKDAYSHFWCLNRHGLLVESMGKSLGDSQRHYARPDSEIAGWKREKSDDAKITLLDGNWYR